MKTDIRELYTDIFDEDKRLCHDQASQIEFLTNQRYILKYLKPGDHILELGAATGIYTTMLAKLGYQVTALEYVEKNIEQLKSKLTPAMKVTPLLGNAIDLSQFPDDSFDVVLNMGPLYHFPKHEDRVKVVKESLRVLKKDGYGIFAFINNDMVFVTEALCYNPDFLTDEDQNYHKPTHKVLDDPFTVLTVESIQALMTECGCVQEKLISSDGYAELLASKINSLSEDKFQKWLDFHFYTCEKPSSLNSSHHLLYITKK